MSTRVLVYNHQRLVSSCRRLTNSHHDAITHTRRPFSSAAKRRGLLSISALQQPSDFGQLSHAAEQECNTLRQHLGSLSSIDTPAAAAETLFQLDAISRSVCGVIDAAELVRSTHADCQWREAAHGAFSRLADYIAELNADVGLYRALQLVKQSGFRGDEEDGRLVELLSAEFERDGIHLPDAERDNVRRLVGQVSDLESLFQRNLTLPPPMVELDAAKVGDVIPAHVMSAYGMDPRPNKEGKLSLPGEMAVLQSLLKYSSDPLLRRDAYMAAHTSVPENLPVLDALQARRHELASALGFSSYAERFLRDKMAGNPKAVEDFLRRLQQSTAPSYRQDMTVVAAAKQHVEGSSEVEPWDVSFYVGLLKSRDGLDPNEVAEYFTLDNSISAMQHLVKHLFGIDMRPVEMADGERWDGDASPKERILRFDFFAEGELGTMYLDLHPRPGKYGHAAHFTVRCGCRTDMGASTKYQRPIIALVCNLTSASSSGMLTHGEVETLFHEFGHALHSLLSRTKYQHMSGTRAAMDFVETPSHLIENYVWDDEFLRILGRHYRTGQDMPEHMIEQLRKSRYEYHSIERQNQIIYAMFDQRLFGAKDSSRRSTAEIFEQLHRDCGLPFCPGTHWYSRFGHLITYGAGYYGYLYSQVFAGDVWQHCLAGNSLSREAGERIWHQMLQHGGARDPALMLTGLLGRPPKVNFFV